ncbi:DUF84 family protein [Candidatus Bathyarchaeota archaeon]|nr:MAG: DUF84 family protein [Candidatus Bathyarchaeota archaeon]
MLKELENEGNSGQVISEITGRVDVQRQEGAIELFTKGKVTEKNCTNMAYYGINKISLPRNI